MWETVLYKTKFSLLGVLFDWIKRQILGNLKKNIISQYTQHDYTSSLAFDQRGISTTILTIDLSPVGYNGMSWKKDPSFPSFSEQIKRLITQIFSYLNTICIQGYSELRFDEQIMPFQRYSSVSFDSGQSDCSDGAGMVESQRALSEANYNCTVLPAKRMISPGLLLKNPGMSVS